MHSTIASTIVCTQQEYYSSRVLCMSVCILEYAYSK